MDDDLKQGMDDAARASNAATDRTASAAKEATAAMRDAGQKMSDTFQSGLAEPARRAGEAMKASGERMAQGGSTIGLKVLDQAETNTHAAFAAMRDAAAAKDLSEVMKIQGEFIREQGTRSMSQAREIGELIMQFGRDAVAPMRGGQ